MKNNVHTFKCNAEPKKILLLSDIHWDNPKCDRTLLKKHLDEALKENCDVLLNGDTMCLMQGKWDGRGSKSDILPEHNVANYIDAVVNTAIDFFSPYASILKVIGYGNHETSVLKRMESDVIERFVYGFNTKNNSNLQKGGYGGWIIYNFKNSTMSRSYKIKYYHGTGGGGPVTRGVIQHNRMSTFVEGADMIWMGHVHENYEVEYNIERLNQNNNVELKRVLMVRTATYKEEYNQGLGGFHVERGASPKPLGGRWLEIIPERIGANFNLHARTYSTL
jgi:predicted phosphodiesterase